MKRISNRFVKIPVIWLLSLMIVNASDIVEVADRSGKFKVLLTAANKAGLVEALKSEGPLTVLAPTDEAFAKLPKGVLSELLKPENKEKLASILKYHVIPSKVDARKIASLEVAVTLQGGELPISIKNGRLTAGPANITGTDIMASNGIIHIVDQVLLPPEESPGEKLAKLIEEAVEAGAPLYNKGQQEACAVIYKMAVKSLSIAGKEVLSKESLKLLENALNRIEHSKSASSKAWTLRGALDRVYEDISKNEKQADVIESSKTSNEEANFKVLVEAGLPEGFPKPGSVNEIVIKEYPVYRAARASGASMQNVAFMRLFTHIKQNGISMTAPVEMEIDSETAQRQNMSFLYSNKRIGKTGATGLGIEVLDLPAQKYLSIGIRGSESKTAIKSAMNKLEDWLSANKHYMADGKPRLLGYNSPMVPKEKRFWEVQIPVKSLH